MRWTNTKEDNDMWMTNYIAEIQRQLIDKYAFKENPEKPGIPMEVVDGEYPMEIEGRTDYVTVEDGIIHCLQDENGNEFTE